MRYGGAHLGTAALRARDLSLWSGQVFPSEGRGLPCLARFQVQVTIGRQNCARLGTSQGSQPNFGPFSSRRRAGQTFAL